MPRTVGVPSRLILLSSLGRLCLHCTKTTTHSTQPTFNVTLQHDSNPMRRTFFSVLFGQVATPAARSNEPEPGGNAVDRIRSNQPRPDRTRPDPEQTGPNSEPVVCPDLHFPLWWFGHQPKRPTLAPASREIAFATHHGQPSWPWLPALIRVKWRLSGTEDLSCHSTVLQLERGLLLRHEYQETQPPVTPAQGWSPAKWLALDNMVVQGSDHGRDSAIPRPDEAALLADYAQTQALGDLTGTYLGCSF
ncbi:hypothetical protein HJFPF1_09278 [Paramyrothecium foliicola]|nr:hypothetical protein HJFPF1_09278 [Paramyrothecium foliicola]